MDTRAHELTRDSGWSKGKAQRDMCLADAAQGLNDYGKGLRQAASKHDFIRDF